MKKIRPRMYVRRTYYVLKRIVSQNWHKENSLVVDVVSPRKLNYSGNQKTFFG